MIENINVVVCGLWFWCRCSTFAMVRIGCLGIDLGRLSPEVAGKETIFGSAPNN